MSNELRCGEVRERDGDIIRRGTRIFFYHLRSNRNYRRGRSEIEVADEKVRKCEKSSGRVEEGERNRMV